MVQLLFEATTRLFDGRGTVVYKKVFMGLGVGAREGRRGGGREKDGEIGVQI